MTSSLMFSVPGIPWSWSCIVFWNISLAELVPKSSHVYLHRHLWVTKVVMYWLSGDSGTWWYSIQGMYEIIYCRYGVTLTSPFFFGVITSGETQGLGPYTCSIIPFFSSFVALLPLFGGCEMEFFLAVVWQDLPFCQCVIWPPLLSACLFLGTV